ncbi:SIMPL domain-containing protein [Alienimonas californiensis]|uniref:Oxidative stress defense protein n=1 Tax=Alienimonas californiensis TaxID=2527989 RepID=A0A517PC78_9PLAN|nr:SIMPL domain-containing protein [Alienimonas californiensis]QDT16951.1 hypothetical protein CA12_30610 [Alienimonas californiensis]
MLPSTVGDLLLPHEPRPSFTVDLTREFKQIADRCDVWLSVRGSTLLTGHAALEQAEEVRKVVEAILKLGVPREAVHLADVSIDSKSGVFTRSTEAAYALRVEVTDLARLADLLTAVTAPKTCRLVRIDYRFSDDEAVADEWIAQTIGDCVRRAKAVAAAAGVTLGTLREVTHEVIRPRPSSYSSDSRLGGFDDDLIGTRLTETADSLPGPVVRERRVRVDAGLRYEIGPPDDPAAGATA